MDYTPLQRSYFRHKKTMRLCALLQSRTAMAWPLLLWDWCIDHHPSGAIDIDEATLEYSLGWTMEKGGLVNALVTAGFLDRADDGTLSVHDWMAYTGAAIEKMRVGREKRSEAVKRFRSGSFPRVEITDDSDCNQREIENAQQSRLQDSREIENAQDKLSKSVRGKKEERAECCEPAGDADSQPSASSGKQSPADDTPVIKAVPCRGPVPTWNLTEGYVANAQGYFPGTDIRASMLRAVFWLEANPDRRKTARGMSRFLAQWIAKDSDRTPSTPQRRPVTASYRPFVAPSPHEPILTRAELDAIKAEAYANSRQTIPDAPGSMQASPGLSGDTQELPLLKSLPRRSQ